MQRLDGILSEVIEARALKCVSGMIGTADQVLYQNAFGDTGLSGAMATDSVVAIMSMTKAVTGAAAMQLVEQGRLELDAPAGALLPYLNEVQVLEELSSAGEPKLRAPNGPVTLRNLLTHTSGFGYSIFDKDVAAFVAATGTPSIVTRQKRALEIPLMFDPGSCWRYGIGIDWVGLMVEAVSGQTLGEYLREHIFMPLGMTDTGFEPTESMSARLVQAQQRQEDGTLRDAGRMGDPNGPSPEFEMGGGGLLSTLEDYGRFVRMILRGGELDGQRVLSKETVAIMGQSHTGDVKVHKIPSLDPSRNHDAEFFPGDPKSWGLTFQINDQDAFTGRKAGTLMWAGLLNSYFWIDPTSDIFGIFITQLLPFADQTSVDTYYKFETAAYQVCG